MKRIHLFIAVFLSILLFGCVASSGENFDEKGLSQLKVGVTTIQEASQLVKAKPVQIVSNPKGQLVAWRYITSNGLTMKTEIKEALVIFDNNGKFVRIFQLQNIDNNLINSVDR